MSCKQWLYVLLTIVLSTTLSAKIWIVDNNPFPVGDYTTLSAVHGVASPGDTVYVYPSATAYAAITVSKQLYFVGAGFDLELHGGQASTANTTISGTMVYDVGSEGAILEGFDGSFVLDINTDDITVKRNELLRMTIDGSGCLVLQNEIIGGVWNNDNIRIGSNLGNILIANNKIFNTESYNADAIESHITSSVTIINNILRTTTSNRFAINNLSASSLAQNNIIVNGTVNIGAIYQYNISNSNQLPSDDGNLINIDMSIVFEDPANFDTGLHLLPGSPAAGNGFGGADMGIYGGDYPFIDGGYPGIPAVYFIESQVITVPQNGLNVRFKAKSNAR